MRYPLKCARAVQAGAHFNGYFNIKKARKVTIKEMSFYLESVFQILLVLVCGKESTEQRC